jgi:hypothetical protein
MKVAIAEVNDFKIGESNINKVIFMDNTVIKTKTQEELQGMVDRLVDTGRKGSMGININNSKSNENIQEKLSIAD